MRSKIIRGGAEFDPQPHQWNTWNTERIDAGALPVEERAPLAAPPPLPQEAARASAAELESARQQGYREGELAGRAACRREVEEAARQMAMAVSNTLREKARLRAEADRDIVTLALAIARKILRREVRIDPGVALGLVKAALETVSSREIQSVRTTPAMAQALAAGLSSLGVPESVRVVADPSLEQGGLILETVRGEVDASLETQFEEISRGLLDAVGEEGRR